MIDPEIPISKIFHAYRRYWWLAVGVFIAGMALGLLLPAQFNHDISVATFSFPVLVREQVSPEWKEDDDYALLSFTHTWLSDAWEKAASAAFPDGRHQVIFEKDYYSFIVEQEHRSIDLAEMQRLANEIYNSFQSQFIEESPSRQIVVVDHATCLTDAAQEVMIECVPATQAIVGLADSETLSLGKYLWVGELGEVSEQMKMPYTRFVPMFAAGICAEMGLCMLLLLDLARRYSAERGA